MSAAKVSRTIVGIAGDTRNSGIANPISPEILAPRLQHPGFIAYLVVRAAHDQNNPTGLSALAVAIHNQALAINPNLPVDQVVSMNE